MNRKYNNEITFFMSHSKPMRTLLITNLIYALVLPIIELFIGAYIMRNSNDLSLVVIFQLAVYLGIPTTFAINGWLLNHIRIPKLYSLGMLLSGISMTALMALSTLTTAGIFVTGLIMGLSYGFFWANRDFLALNTTNDSNRNYYYGVETFFYTMAGIIMPAMIGAFLASTEKYGWFNHNLNFAYYCLAGLVIILTIVASFIVHTGGFQNPKKAPFIFFKFDPLWGKMLKLAMLKGVGQGYIVTAPTMLIMTLVGKEGALGSIQSIAAFISAILMYLIGRISKPEHRLQIFGLGLVIFVIGALFNAVLYSAIGAILFVLFLIFARPLLDIAYFPIQLQVIDVLAKKEKRNEFAYIFNHEIGLLVGRLFGCGTFILLAWYVSDYIALRYALLLIAIVQFLSYFMAKKILNDPALIPSEKNLD